MARNTLPDQAYLLECFRYDPESGVLWWRERPLSHFSDLHTQTSTNTRFAGKAVVSKSQGYYRVMVADKQTVVHRIIYKMMTADDPPRDLDHQNRDRSDNRWDNLRLALPSQNSQNRGIRSDNKSGLKGAYYIRRDKIFASGIMRKGLFRPLGYFHTAEEAHSAYVSAAKEEYGEFWSAGSHVDAAGDERLAVEHDQAV